MSSTGQLDSNSHLVSIFQNKAATPYAPDILMQQNQNHIKATKMVKPSKNSIKEKEQLYEDAIKLKMQAN